MDFDQYSKLTDKEKIKYLMEEWNLEKPILIGKVTNKGQGYIGIGEIFNIENESKVNPFSYDGSTWVFCSVKKDYDTELLIGDNVIFEFDVSTMDFQDSDDAKQRIIVCKSIEKLINISEIQEKTCNELLEILRTKNNPLIDKRLISEDIKLILEKKETEIESLNKKNVNLSKQLEDKIKLKEKFERYGFKFEKQYKSDYIQGVTYIQKEEYIKYIQAYLASRENKKLYYEQEVLEQFYAGLCTNQLLILSGQPGSGKTSLVEGFCDAIGAKLKIISVQPNWTDNQDLIGFYNPIENTYISTQFLDTIIEAKENPGFLYVICLDEMNLAYVEYYFSEFLSKMQSESKTINLYSDYLYNQAKDEIITKLEFLVRNEELNVEDKIDKLKDIDINEYYKLKKQWNSVNRYASNIEIPSNLKFVGTINKDETTKDLSPKVIDRSYIMEIDCGIDKARGQIGQVDVSGGRLYIHPSEFVPRVSHIDNEFNNRLSDICDTLKKINIRLSNRIFRQVEELVYADIFKHNDIFDVVVATKILPKINVEVDDENIVMEINKHLENTALSSIIFNKMQQYWNENGVLTFWR